MNEISIKKKPNVFFNPEMKFNRDISCIVLKTDFISKAKNKKPYSVCDAMSATGIRGIRYFNTLKNTKSNDFEIYFSLIEELLRNLKFYLLHLLNVFSFFPKGSFF